MITLMISLPELVEKIMLANKTTYTVVPLWKTKSSQKLLLLRKIMSFLQAPLYLHTLFLQP